MSDYLLGHDETEWSRLAEQHTLWREGLLAALGSPGRILEVGCGSGELLAELGPGARGLERDPRAAQRARARGLEVVEGDLMSADLGGPWDTVVARWVLSFLPDAPGAVARLAGALAPAGRLVIQDYNHDGLGVFPAHDAIGEVIEAFRAAYRATGGDLWVARRLPGLLQDAGLVVERIAPEVMAGPAGSPPFRWVERFLFEHVHTVVEAGLLSAPQVERFAEAWAAARADTRTVLFTPMQVTIVGRRP